MTASSSKIEIGISRMYSEMLLFLFAAQRNCSTRGVGLQQERQPVTVGCKKLHSVLRSCRDNPVCAGWTVDPPTGRSPRDRPRVVSLGYLPETV